MFDCRSDKYYVPFELLQKLYRANVLQVSVDDVVATKLIADGVIREIPNFIIQEKTGWPFILLMSCIFSLTIIVSFAISGWCFILGGGIMYLLYNKKGNTSEIVSKYTSTKKLYETLANAEGVLYRFERQVDADVFFRKD